MATYKSLYNDIWEWIYVDGSAVDVYWRDYGDLSWISWLSYSRIWEIYNATTSFSASSFQPLHVVWMFLCKIARVWPWDAETQTVRIDYERYDGSWHIPYRENVTVSWSAVSSWYQTPTAFHWILPIRNVFIRPWYSKYRLHIYCQWVWGVYSPEFTVSNLSIDSTLHPAWALWVEWNHLCYTDNTWLIAWHDGYWYKHKIACDSSYSTSVWSWNAWYIRLDSSDLLRIYYVDSSWRRRRTYSSHDRRTPTNVWSSNKWFMRVGTSTVSNWDGCLCFIWPNWSKRRILNWPPIWYT